MDEADALLAQRLADAYETLGQSEAAREQLVRLYDLSEADRVGRARAAHRLAQGFATEARWGEALQWYERALELSQIHSFRAELIARMGDIAQEMADEGYAVNQWRLLVEEYPDTPEALQAAARLSERGDPLSLFEMGELYLANERWQLAARAFFDSLEEEDRAGTHQQAALALEGAGQWAAARDEWQKLLDTHPEADSLFPEALLGVARAQARLGGAGALDTWNRLAERYPESAAARDALWERAVFRREQGSDPRAIAFAYESLGERYPDDARAETALGEAAWLRFRAEQPERALADWAAMAALQGEREPEALFWAGKVARQMGDEQAAQGFWRRAMQLPGAGYYSLRARALLEEREWQPRAASDFAMPAAFVGDDLAWLRAAAGVDEGAMLQAEPSEPLFRQGEAMLFLGERDRALGAFYNAVLSREGEPQELWAMAQRLRVLNLPGLSIVAAFRLMDTLGYDALSAPPALALLAYPIPFEEPLRAAAGEWGVDPLFFASVIHQESAWEPRARSAAAARGLTQVIPDTGEWISWRLGDADYEYRKLDRPTYSLRYGGYYLDYVLDTFEDNPFHALAAYNAGPGNAQRWLAEDDDLFVEGVTSTETRTYLEEIYRRWAAYTRLYRGS